MRFVIEIIIVGVKEIIFYLSFVVDRYTKKKLFK